MNKEEKKTINTKYIIIALILFTILCVGIIVLLIFNKINSNTKEHVDNEEIKIVSQKKLMRI